MEKLSLKEIAAAVGSKTNVPELMIDSVCTDTRKIEEGCLFIALKGQNFDGHDYIKKAFELGAAAAISEKEIKQESGKAVLKVDSTARALLALAGYYRRLFSLKLVGVTGSVGKTSTKEMIYSVLKQRYKTLKTQGNHNNEIGLPTTLFGLDKTFEAAVIEMGMSHFGEISRLSKTAAPDIGVITNIGVSHIENLGDRVGILKAKLEITNGLSGEYPLVICADDDKLCSVCAPSIKYGINNKNADVTADNIMRQEMTTRFDIIYGGASYPASVPAVGIHNVYNALAAFCVGIELHMNPGDIIKGISEYESTGMRQNIVKYGGITVIEDCYNASPDSMKASLDVLQEIAPGRKIAVLGDMLELGEYSEQFHREVGEYAAKKADVIYCFGSDAEFIKASAQSAGAADAACFKSKDELSDKLLKISRSGDTVLFKASRGMKLEEVIKKTYKECAKCQ